MATVLRDKPFYRSGGGITLSGGEPFMNPELAHALFKASHDGDPHRRRNLPARAVALYRAVITLRRSVSRRPEARDERRFKQWTDGSANGAG
jgi:pyruvate formate lyase activating enzyme